MPTYQNYIDGAWVASSSGDLFENRNPANDDDLIGLFPKSTGRDVADAVDAARRAYPRWRLVPAPRRAEMLFRAAQLLAERKEALARDMTREMGKVLDGDARRRAGSDRHDLLHGGRRAAVSTARRFPPSCATSSRCRSASRSASAP